MPVDDASRRRAEEILQDRDTPPLSQVIRDHHGIAAPPQAELDRAMRANPQPDIYEPLEGPAAEDPTV